MCLYKLFDVNGLDGALVDTGKVIDCIKKTAVRKVLDEFKFQSKWDDCYIASDEVLNTITISYSYLAVGHKPTWVLKKE